MNYVADMKGQNIILTTEKNKTAQWGFFKKKKYSCPMSGSRLLQPIFTDQIMYTYMAEMNGDETLQGHAQDKSEVEWQQYHHDA